MKLRLTLLALGFSSALSACGPFFPVSYLSFDAPRRFENELTYDLELLGRRFYPGEWEMKTSGRPALSTPEATRADFLEAGRELPEAERQAALERYLAFDSACRGDGGVPPYDLAAIPARFREFYLYSAGFNQMRKNGGEQPPEAWLRLSALPEQERNYRTGWTLYMLGNMRRNPAEKYEYYRKLRDAVAAGAVDSCELAKRSLRLNWLTAKDPADKLRYLAADPGVNWTNYMARHAAGLAEEAWKQNSKRMCEDPLLREIALLTLGPRRVLPELPPDFQPLTAERLAVRCYFQNDLDGCRMLLTRIPEDSLIRLYLEARFARRDGNTALTAEKLSKWLKIYREQSRRPASPFRFTADGSQGVTEYATPENDAGLPEEVNGMLGTVLVCQEDFLEALHAFFAARAWNDAAIVADLLLPTNALVEYCRNHTKADTEVEFGQRLRNLLARRLMREYKVKEAGEFFSSQYQPLYKLYLSTVTAANDPNRSGDERATALFQLGRILRQQGMSLYGNELTKQEFALYLQRHPQTSNDNQQAGQIPVETLPENATGNHRRLRRQAADCFARAAMLAETPDLKAAGLWAAGACLKAQYPAEANQYYLMLCDLTGAPMSAEAKAGKWFPRNPQLHSLLFEDPLEPAPTREEIVRAAKQAK